MGAWWRCASTLVTSTKVPAQTVYEITKAVFENFEEFKKLHPAFANLDPKTMISSGVSAPLHEGAARYYREKGWIIFTLAAAIGTLDASPPLRPIAVGASADVSSLRTPERRPGRRPALQSEDV